MLSRRTCTLVFVAFVCLSALFVAADRDDDDDDDYSYAVDGPFVSCEDNSHLPYTSYVNFRARPEPGTADDSGRILSARLKVPKVNGIAPAPNSMPAVVIVHGSAGVDTRNEFYSVALNKKGVATLEVDLWASRGWYGGVTGRPRGVPETVPDAYGALQFLQTVPALDKSKIGLMGFSWGGVVSMLSATAPFQQKYGAVNASINLRFAAHVAHYPICWGYNHVPGYSFVDLTGADILIQTGSLDDYDTPTSCSSLISTLTPANQARIALNMYNGATHGFDRLEPTMTVTDPFSHQGRGGNVTFVPNPKVAKEARKAAMKFFKKEFNLKKFNN